VTLSAEKVGLFTESVGGQMFVQQSQDPCFFNEDNVNPAGAPMAVTVIVHPLNVPANEAFQVPLPQEPPSLVLQVPARLIVVPEAVPLTVPE
jgi:hypothetical protein